MRNRIRIGTGLAVLVLLMTVGERPKAQAVPSYDQAAVAGRGYFYVGGSYVGGSYVGDAGKKVMHGQMYVEVLTPARGAPSFPARTHPRRGADRDELEGSTMGPEGNSNTRSPGRRPSSTLCHDLYPAQTGLC